ELRQRRAHPQRAAHQGHRGHRFAGRVRAQPAQRQDQLHRPRQQQPLQHGLSILSAQGRRHMIPAPNLDDRSFEDIVQEAITLIPKYCPEWTNHNPTEPGVTLIELFAWMTEMVIYRLNKVTDKNYLAFLELMGI